MAFAKVILLVPLISTDFDIIRQMGEEEYQVRLQMFQQLIPEVTPYIQSQARRKAPNLPVSYMGVDDLVGIGNIGAWVATLRWDGRTPLVGWAKRLIWSRTNLTFGYLYRRKRTPRVMAEGRETPVPLLSLEDIGIEVPARGPDAIDVLIAEEVYNKVRKQLHRRNKRVAAGVLRLLVSPDRELLRLCERDATRKGRRQTRVTSYCIAKRLGVTAPRVANAKVALRAVFKELWGD